MEKETVKEMGKLSFDIAKIITAIAILQPLIRDEKISLIAIFSALIFMVGGIILINKGAKNG